MTGTRVPFVDLAAQHAPLEKELLEAVAPLIRNGRFVGGDPVERFERSFADVHGVPFAVSVKSGTAALQLTLEAMGLREKDEVLVPAFTFIATAASVVRAGAVPVFVDVDPETACMDPAAAGAAVTDRTRGMIPVHLYGHPAPMDALTRLAEADDLQILEDCAQSHLATWNGKPTGSLGRAAAFSFYPSKNLGAGGDGGCVLTADEKLADTVRRLANHGRADRYRHEFLGWNERMDAIQAALLAVKLRRLPEWTARRREAAARYHTLLEGAAPWGEPLRLPVERGPVEAVYHLYVVRHPRRDDLHRALGERGIDTATHYPLPVPDQPAFERLGLGGGSYPVSREWSRTALSLPFFPEITAEQQERVAEALRSLPA